MCATSNLYPIGQLGKKELAAKAIESIIFDESVPLRKLALSYNSFRSKHMIAFARAFQENTTLVQVTRPIFTHIHACMYTYGCMYR
eukprot:COSAG05_NODE_825_length_7106_cov_74.690881_13_plen_86_part_00